MSTPLASIFVEARLNTAKMGDDIKSGLNAPQVTQAADVAGKKTGGQFGAAFERAKKSVSGKPIPAPEVQKPVIPKPDLPDIPPLEAPEIPKPDASKFKAGLAALAGSGAIFGAAFAEAVGNEASGDKLAAQLGVSGSESKRLGKVAGSLYSNAYGDSLETVNASIRGVVNNIDGMRKASKPQLEAITASVLDISTAFDEEGDAVTRAAGQLVRTGMAKNAREALDVITVGFQSGADKSQDFLDTMNEYGTQFRKLGIDGKTATGILSQGLKAGARDADIVADSIKEFSLRTTGELLKVTQTADGPKYSLTALGEAFKAAGYDANGSLKEFRAATKLQDDIAAGGKGAKAGLQLLTDGLRSTKDPLERSRNAVALFGTQAEDMGDALYAIDPSKAVDGIGKVGGAAEKMGKTLNDNASANITTFYRTLKTGATNVLGGTVIPKVSEMAATFNQKYVPAIKDTIEVTSDIVGWFKDHKTTTMALVGAVGAAVAVTKIHTAVMAVQAAGGLIPLLKGTKLVTAVTKTWTAVQWLLNAALTANPIGLVVVALGLLGLGLAIAWRKSETFRKITTAAFEAIKEKTQIAALFVADKVLWMAEKMLGAMAFAFSWVPGLGDKLKKASSAIKEFREDVNREMDQIRDEEVNIGFAVGRRKSQESSNSGFGPQIAGGRGPIPRSAMGGGGNGLVFRPQTSGAMRGVAQVASSAQASAHETALALAKKERAKRAKQGMSSGPSGPAGRVLPRGSYRIGMPYHGYAGHNGADYPAPIGTPVYAPWAGRVTASYDLPGSNPYNSTPYRSYGRVVKIAYENGMSSLFAHLSERIGRLGPIAAGAMVGRVGTNGNSSGPHLHAEFNGGSTNPASLGIFDRGGIMKGLGINLSGQPERVLSPYQTKLHERQTLALEKSARGGGLRPIHVHVGNQEFVRMVDDRIESHVDLTSERRRAR